MPSLEIPEEIQRPLGSPSNSSLSSNSSDVLLVRITNSQSESSVSSETTNTQDDNSIESNFIDVNNRNFHSRQTVEVERMTYQPIKLPTEPTLEELLRQVTGGGEIQEIQQIKLRIISPAISLHRLPYFMPRLRGLNLEGSMLFSLRDLGCDLTSLVYLNISRCGLKSLDGTNGLSNLIELVADFNLIEDAGPCSNLTSISKLSLISNKIKDFQGVMFLGFCNQLRVLDLENNLVNQKINYRDVVQQNIPSLIYLDKIPYREIDEETKRELLRSEYQPENNGTVRRNLQLRINESIDKESSENLPLVTHISITKRPATADAIKPKYDVSVGEPVCGSIITKARKSRKLKTAWGDSCSSSSFSSSDSSTHGTPVIKRSTTLLEENEESCETLLENSRLWRERSKETRERFNK
ncbi:CLUMA_CG009951, isoform A [Clunio marinus]|uniref:CLUMA_CG009951, isoform A n=1 Tax=Clunio marinus TaxID=568069 RepID=A0A1J1I8I2_9DIPT|nr:CLUMA_CG009951, isoform A [Clunio marinus]